MDEENQKPGFLQKYKLTFISLFIIILAAIPLLLLLNTAPKKSIVVHAPLPTAAPVTPTPAPLTTSNVQPTLTQEDSTIQQDLNQVDNDIQAANSIDGSQDNTTGL